MRDEGFKTIRNKDYGFRWREMDKGDQYILNESSYTCLFDPTNKSSLLPEDVWLDVGANFGSFAIRISPHVKDVIALEPEPTNLSHLRENIELNDIKNIVVVGAASIAGPSQEVPLALGHTFNYTHRVGHVRGRKEIMVPGVNINETVEYFCVNKIKMDCEGSEKELLEALDYDPIQEIILEWHFTLIPDADWTFVREAIERFKEKGFTLRKFPQHQTKRWTAIIWAVKE